MAERAASGTAVGVAMLRAAHLIIDGPPPILNDSVIVRLLGVDAEERIRTNAARLDSAAARGLRSHVLLRSRFAEDSLRDAVARGIRQYVLLGAGLDTFAYRQPPWASEITIVEVDQPASQQNKLERLSRAGITPSPNVRHVAVDFERESLADGLRRHGVDMHAPTFFSWLGVTMYLQRDATDAVLRTTAAFGEGSEIVLTFAQRSAESDGASPFAEAAAQGGEPWVSYFTPAELDAAMLDAGYSRVEFLSREEAARRYFADRTDGLETPRRVSIARGAV